MGDAYGNSNIAPSLNCRVRFCNFKGGSVQSLWDHLQLHHGAPLVEGSLANFRVQWCDSDTTFLGHRVVGLAMFSGRRFSVWILDQSDEVYVYAKELRDVASTPSPPLSLSLSSEQNGTSPGVTFTGQNGVLTISRQAVLENLTQKSNNKLEAWVSIQLDNDQLPFPTTPMCPMNGIVETSVPKLNNSVLHSSRVTAGDSPEPLGYSPIEKSYDQDSLDVLNGSTEEDTVMTVVEASAGGLFDVSEPPLCDPTVAEAEAPEMFVGETAEAEAPEKTFVVEESRPAEPDHLATNAGVHSKAVATSAKVQLASKLPKPKWKY